MTTSTPNPYQLHTIPLTCLDDSREHLVRDHEFRRGRSSGYAIAVCGHETHIGPAVAPVGRRCQDCESYRSVRTNVPDLGRRLEPARRRDRKPSRLARLLGGVA